MTTCVICKNGRLAPGRATATFDRGSTTVVIRNVPADVCQTCGEAYYISSTTERLLELAETAVRAGVQVELRDYVAA
jgi:YgiT-type zinc finger domain-containing protein